MAALQRMREALKNREVSGWRLFRHDEDWLFVGARDVAECPICRGFEHTVHRGDWVPRRFPDRTVISSTMVAANLHQRCRCILEWSDSAEKIRARLHEELVNVL